MSTRHSSIKFSEFTGQVAEFEPFTLANQSSLRISDEEPVADDYRLNSISIDFNCVGRPIFC